MSEIITPDQAGLDQHVVEVNEKTFGHLLSGRAIFTLESKATGTRFTYKVTKKEEDGKPPLYFVGLLSGPNNSQDYRYLAFVGAEESLPRLTARSCAGEDAASYKAIRWAFHMLGQEKVEEFSEQVNVWHEGRCFRCSRRLTVPESIQTGLGPVCAEMI